MIITAQIVDSRVHLIEGRRVLAILTWKQAETLGYAMLAMSRKLGP